MKDAQKSDEYKKIWNNVFRKGKNVNSKTLIEHDIFSQGVWKLLYELVMVFPVPPAKLLGAADEETRQNLEQWKEAHDKEAEEWRKEAKELEVEWQRGVDAGGPPMFQIIGLPLRDEGDDSEEGA